MVETVDRALEGIEVAITGRLASMSRDEAVERLTAAGARYTASIGRETRLLVVGQGGPPLGEDGRLTRHLREARDLIRAGAALRIVPEEELLAALGLPERRDGLDRLYTTAQLARILDVPQQELRAWVRNGLIEPVKVVRRLCFFDFRQVAVAKSLSRLAAGGVTPQRIRRSLVQLSAWLPDAHGALAQLQALELGGPLLVRTRTGRLAETSGQLRLDFDAEPSGPPPAAPAPERPAADEDGAGFWFRQGVQLEEEDRPEEAIVAYAKALKAGPATPELAFNLGNALYASARKDDAARCFALATEIEPEYVEAWNNLGNALVETGREDEGVAAFRRALANEPDYADAHFNLAETLAERGEIEEAREHWLAYLEQDPFSLWAVEVRKRLYRTE